MKNLRNTGLALAAFCMASTAVAQFSHLEVDYIDNGGVVPGDTYRVYAVMENEGDILDAIYGEKSAPMKITSTAPFFQHLKGGALSADIQRYDTTKDPTLLYDSWVTIGAEDNYMNAVSGFIMNFESFNAGGELATNDGAWFCDPGQASSCRTSFKAHLLMQLTTAGEVEVLNVHGRRRSLWTDADGNVVGGQEVIQSEGLTFVCKKPKR